MKALHSSLGFLASLLFSSQCCAVQAANASSKWYLSPWGNFQTNLRVIDAGLDVDRVSDFIRDYGASTWLINTADFHIRNPYLSERKSGDLIGDAIEAAHSRGLRVLGRVDFSKIQQSVAEKHPDWVYISPNGTWQNHTNNVVSACPSGPWYQEKSFEIFDEILSRYKLDGFFTNWASMNERDYSLVYHGVCHCNNCKTGWKKAFGNEKLPNGPQDANYAKWQQWSNILIATWAGQLQEFVSKRRPEVGLITRNGGNIKYHEANRQVGGEIWFFTISQDVSSFMVSQPQFPVMVNIASFLDTGYRFATEHPAMLDQYHLQTISRGGMPSTYIIGAPGSIPWPGLNSSSKITKFHADNSKDYKGLVPIAKTGLVLPPRPANETAQLAMNEYKGLYMALLELHIPFDVITQSSLSTMAKSGMLNKFENMILPNLGQLTSNDSKAVDEWVATGGLLFVTGLTGVDEDQALQLKSVPAASLLNTTTENLELWSLYFAPEQNKTYDDIYTGNIVPILGTYYQYEWKKGTSGLYKKLDFAPFAPPEYIYGNRQVEERGTGIGAYHKGTGVITTIPIGRGYWDYGLPSFRNYFEEIWNKNAAKEQLQFDLPEQIEVTIGKNSRNNTVIHLNNVSGMRHQNYGARMPVPPGGAIKILEGNSNVKARALVSCQDLEVEVGKITVPGFDLFEVIVIET
ncbi:glycosyl hydrolase 6-domain-containing protein [Fusarium oxysporum f. sp. albedinis]|nr:glycosyl hydrolase 6-domain-containing protein [Fusarium oxysporum f. sp. albedinis]